MRPKADEFEIGVVRLAINENEVWPNVAVAMVVPFAGQRMIDVAARKLFIRNEKIDDLAWWIKSYR